MLFPMNATILENELAVEHIVREEVGREFLKFKVPNGWDDVKKVSRKVLEYDGKKFIFSGWNSDHNYCCFYRMLDGSTKTAKIVKK